MGLEVKFERRQQLGIAGATSRVWDCVPFSGNPLKDVM